MFSPIYSFMIATSLATGLFSLIFLYLSHHMERAYMRFWGFTMLGYTVIFLMDFLFLENHGSVQTYTAIRIIISIACSVLFLYGALDFFLIKVKAKLLYGIFASLGLMILSLFVDPLYEILHIPMIIFLSLLLVSSGMVFFLYSWTSSMKEKYLTGSVVIIWSIFSANVPYTFTYTALAMVNYTIGLCILIIMSLLLMILHFKMGRLKLAIQERHYRMLVENAAGAILLYNYSDGKFKYISPSVDIFLDYDADKLLADPDMVYEGIDSEGVKNMKELFGKPITESKSFAFSKRTSEGDEKWYELYATPVSGAQLEAPEVECVISDITLRMETINGLRLSEKSRKELIEDISHELRTPITLIQGYSEIMLKDDDYAANKSFMEIIHSKSVSMNLLLDDLIQGSDFTSQSVEYVYYEVNIKDYLVQILREYHWLIEANDRVACCKNIDQSNCIAIIDEDRINQVLSNLVNNALKFTKANDSIDIICSAERTGRDDSDMGKLTIRVSDSGMGTGDENLNDLFKRKYRGKIDKGYAHEGSGLGLYISREIISEHGGEIWAQKNPGGGMSFIFTLPCRFE